MIEIVKGAIFGLAVADALGVRNLLKGFVGELYG